ncbi:MAG: hypothetical protein NDJ90_11810, partial [Oligoflexia bacterium]|nr:hypothetical protein [Oligoflexia bacterium]
MLKKFAFWSTLALAVILAVTAGAAFADTQTRVVKVSTDAYPGASYLDVVRGDDGALNGMVYFGSDGKVIRLSLAQLRTGPQLLKEMDGHPVIYLGLEDDFSETRGGHVTVRFL